MPSDEPSDLAVTLNLVQFTKQLMDDLRLLRAGKISTRDAHARAELARQVLRSVHYIVNAQKFLSERALPGPSDAP